MRGLDKPWACLQNAPKRVYVDHHEVHASGSNVSICENITVAGEQSHDCEKAMAKDKESKVKNDAVKKSDDTIKGTKRKTESEAMQAKNPKKKDPNAPKRPCSGFFIFLQSFRDSYKKANPEMKYRDVSKACGEKWKQMTDAEKAPYIADATARKNAYFQAVMRYKNAESSKEAEFVEDA